MRERLLTEAERLLARTPGSLPTTQQLADMAHVSIGTVYRYFESIDSVVDELRSHAIRDITTDLATGVGTALGQEPMDAMVTVVETLTSSFERHQPILSVTVTAGDEGQLWPEVEGPLVPLARVLPARLRPDLLDRELDDLVFLTMGATASLCLRIALFREPDADRDALVAAAARMLLAAFAT
ncbi:TetR/AcrR family transcriptional regulator [Gordonia sp. HY442]|uniref:TetR/AcrR family transcriptional regulator n=1 Tax=Gordonia zhenghanii TaxID=2911516 RepID=UPI001F224CBA|nr:TetR/AcrR family transcriptional regulator [Gordonia zhenghanii]MCF8607250.1 TetR/AcrR family transcriptional regulator [Gordonia zhenghanii]